MMDDERFPQAPHSSRCPRDGILAWGCGLMEAWPSPAADPLLHLKTIFQWISYHWAGLSLSGREASDSKLQPGAEAGRRPPCHQVVPLFCGALTPLGLSAWTPVLLPGLCISGQRKSVQSQTLSTGILCMTFNLT
ncbi:hypothetical protein SKAU_G00427930 [Synaphobranchus kaupii]|uniref:Uncharacterized protein n=1 Tax=Synaphobranchus kaupii TaxID=118154 RepID=A0A9Q1I8C8_SYNKA|nr:hypothetical protein SKAU_G00427930 [Synaphobranchus kaupii]